MSEALTSPMICNSVFVPILDIFKQFQLSPLGNISQYLKTFLLIIFINWGFLQEQNGTFTAWTPHCPLVFHPGSQSTRWCHPHSVWVFHFYCLTCQSSLEKLLQTDPEVSFGPANLTTVVGKKWRDASDISWEHNGKQTAILQCAEQVVTTDKSIPKCQWGRE